MRTLREPIHYKITLSNGEKCLALELTRGKFTLVSQEAIDKDPGILKQLWYTGRSKCGFYASRKIELPKRADGTRHRKDEKLHRRIMGLTHDDPRQVDHINSDTFDNRTPNLRICTHQENQLNKPVKVTSGTGFKGVYKINRTGKTYMMRITYNGIRYYEGGFKDPQSASDAYLAKARELHKEFARI